MLHFNLVSFLTVLIINISLVAAETPAKEPVTTGTVETVKKTEIEYSGRQDNAWVEMQKELTALKIKLDAQQAIVSELLTAQKSNKSNLPRDQVEQLKNHDQVLKNLTIEYAKALNKFELKYPEKGQSAARQYSRSQAKSVGQESKVDLEKSLDKMNHKIEQQYKTKIKAQKKPLVPAAPVKPARIDITDKITVVK